MNCRDFVLVVGDLVRSELPSGRPVLPSGRPVVDAAVEGEARAHAASCSRCQNRLRDERELAKALQLVSWADQEKSASLIDEITLRSAYRDSYLSARGGLTGAVPQQHSRPARLWWGLAVAACVTLLVGGTLLWRVPEVKPAGPISLASPTPRLGSAIPAPVSERLEQTAEGVREGLDQERSRNVRPVGMRLGAHRVIDSSYVAVSMGEFQPVSAELEEATEFFPMAQGAEGGPMTSGQVVRVVMPRTAMTYFGLPVNIDRADEKVKADVLLGEDGLARAIRFVR